MLVYTTNVCISLLVSERYVDVKFVHTMYIYSEIGYLEHMLFQPQAVRNVFLIYKTISNNVQHI